MLNTCGVLLGYHSDDIYVNIKRFSPIPYA